MEQILVLILLLIIVVTVFAISLRALIRTWLSYREKMAVLEKFEMPEDPEEAEQEVDRLLGIVSAPVPDAPRISFILTGICLGVIAAVCLVTAPILRTGHIAVGLELGGNLLVILSLTLTGVGLLMRYLSRRPQLSIRSLFTFRPLF
jgi:hypothetical protein